MAGLKEKTIEFLKKGLTTTPKERAAMMIQPGGIGSADVAAFSATEKKATEDKIIGFTEPGKCCCGRVHPIKQSADEKERIETGWY